MKRILQLIGDWIIYLIFIALFSEIWNLGVSVVINFYKDGQISIQTIYTIFIVLNFIATPVFLFGFTLGRLMDVTMRNKFVCLKCLNPINLERRR